ncbi:hypothetical protein PVAND_001900 [Polypedilum vanderplanki]|uniref:Uncharacterized protein n=1 Tax=Polypedilum vanderplanki TaxID=319348 RepID=A0A9J6BPT1_POLVA|nr:hypothetical protein PVAND_001900 [Polypedilum vanderplanki]
MIHLIKLYTCLLIVVCAARFIEGSCLSYGHSCYGAHGKRSFVPQKDLKPNDSRWALFKFNDRNDILPMRKFMRERFPDNEPSMNLPAQFSSYDDESLRNYADLTDENEDIQQKQFSPRVGEPYQALRLNKQINSLNNAQ